jgi:chromosome segregation ATPase
MKQFFLTCLVLVTATAAQAAEQNPAEAKLRESLRNTMLQMRTLQGERDTLQAAKDQADAEKKALEQKLAALTKDCAGNQVAAEKQLAETQEKLTAQLQETNQLRESLDKWKASHRQATELSEKREVARVKLNSEKIVLQRTVEDQRRKNQEMYKIGTEVLSRYEGFGLGTAITAREPFTGTMKVRLQNLVQDFADKLADQRIKPEPPAHPVAKP